MQRHQDPLYVASTKLSQDWSANRGVPHINPEFLNRLLSDDRFATMESAVKIRLLLAGMLALDQVPAASAAGGGSPAASDPAQQRQQQAQARAQVHESLQQLRSAVAADGDEWCKIMAAAAGDLQGRLDLPAVMQRSAVVLESVTSLQEQVQASNNQHVMPPLEDLYLRNPPSVLKPDAGIFVVRQNPAVLPLSGGFSYTQATPPPPGFLQAQGGHGAQQQQHQQQMLPKPRQQGVSGRLSGAGGPWTKPGPERQHSVQLLDAAEQADLFKNAQLKPGNRAAAVRHEQLVYEKPARKQHQDQQQQRLSPAAAGAGGNTSGAHGGAKEPVASDDVDALFEDSDDDGGGGADWQDVAPSNAPASTATTTGRSNAGGLLLHRQGALGSTMRGGASGYGDGFRASAGAGFGMKHERLNTPEDLVEDLQDEDFGGEGGDDGVEHAAPAGRSSQRHQQLQQRRQLVNEDDEDFEGQDGGDAAVAGGSGLDQQQQQQAVAASGQAHAAPVQKAGGSLSGGMKRRRHIIEDDSDDDD